MPPQGRLGDLSFVPADAHGCPSCAHPCIGPAIQGSPDVLVNARPALRVEDLGIHAACCGPNLWNAAQGSKTVLINGKPAHRLTDEDKHCGGKGLLIMGSPNVITGGPPTSTAPSQDEKQEEEEEEQEQEEQQEEESSESDGQGGPEEGGKAGKEGQGMQMQRPADGRTTSPYGMRTHPVTGARKMHNGIDIGCPSGTPIHAAAGGTVTHSGWMNGYGNTVMIDHGGGVSSLYGHMSGTSVSAGQAVSAGQVVGACGSTGVSTGPHLHFTTYQNGGHVNPSNFGVR